jgi:hypothetical protein
MGPRYAARELLRTNVIANTVKRMAQRLFLTRFDRGDDEQTVTGHGFLPLYCMH